MLLRLRLMLRRFRFSDTDFGRLYNFKEEHCTGRALLLLNTFFCGIGNVFITGTFYTAFLTENGIDIVKVGIITFIPYFCWVFGLFAPKILSRFKKRRALILFNHIFYYVCVVLGTTVMPIFVKDPDARTVWFAVFLVLGNLCNALIGSGASAWHIHFLPEGKDRNFHFAISNLVANLIGTATAIGASFAADALAGSPRQGVIITTLRFVSFGLFILSGLLLYLIPKEYPYEKAAQVKLQDVFVIPIRDKKFILTLIITIVWNFVCNLNANTWTYYILNTVGMNYLMTYVGSIVIAIGGIFLMNSWRSAISQHSWFKVIAFNVFIAAINELLMGFVTENTLYIFIIGSVISGLNMIGAQITFSNVFYINLPRDKTYFDVYITFNNFAANIAVFLGSMFGTWALSMLETADGSARILFGLPFYGSQFLVWIKCVLFLLLALYIKLVTPKIQPDHL
ncbi:MAG: hypothetical protein IJ412_02530 [Oscillospiraceae bacterium]|nr:hypothetical protein [Oscillospiraceae bacterium]